MRKIAGNPLKNLPLSSVGHRNNRSHEGSATALVSSLSARELEILKGIVAGDAVRTIAARLDLDLEIANNSHQNMMAKLNARLTCDAVRIGLYAGLGA
jgi:FixJ family two-component response regulator